MTTGAVDGRPAGAARRARAILAVFGPGLLVMLADTDAGSVVTAAQSGAKYGYKLLLFQLVLVPILYLTQELTARLGIVTGKGQAALIRERYGARWAWLATAALVAACAGALLTELAGIAAVGAMVRLPAWLSMLVTVAGLSAMAVTGSFRSVERIALAVGAFEVSFVLVAVLAHPNWAQFAHDARSIPLADPAYLTLVSANIGAVIMPWMVFYQQGSVIEKGLGVDDLPSARADTAVGSVVTQLVMAAVLVAAASALAAGGRTSFDDIGQIADALTGVLGAAAGRLCFGLGVLGASTVAAIVVTLTAARALGEVTGAAHSLDRSPAQEPLFYGAYIAVLALAGLAVALGVPVVRLSVAVQVMNAMLLPLVLAFLFLLARQLPEPHRLGGARAWITGALMLLVAALGLVSGIASIIGGDAG